MNEIKDISRGNKAKMTEKGKAERRGEKKKQMDGEKDRERK